MQRSGWTIGRLWGCFGKGASRDQRLLLVEQRDSELGDSASSRSQTVGSSYHLEVFSIMNVDRHARCERCSRVLLSVVE